MNETLIITVLGASGNLAKYKIYPSLFELYINNYLPNDFFIIGYSRTNFLNNEEFRKYLQNNLPNSEKSNLFQMKCTYLRGNYDDLIILNNQIISFEEINNNINRNRIFYLAVPPCIFLIAATSIKQYIPNNNSTGYTRLIIEKPFGHDLDSCNKMNKKLNELFNEESLYRIDHYLGKEMVQNLLTFRFGNVFLEPIFNKNYINRYLSLVSISKTQSIISNH